MNSIEKNVIYFLVKRVNFILKLMVFKIFNIRNLNDSYF